MRRLTLVLLLPVLFMCVTGFSCGRCEPPDCREEVVCDSTGWNCHVERRRRHFSNSPQTAANQMGENVGILDLANPWQPDMNGLSRMTIKFENSSGEISKQTFSLSPAPAATTANIARVDNETTPWAFVFDDPAAVNNFMNTAPAAEDFDWDETITFDFAITQVDCTAKSGRYINHLRQMDSSGIMYDKSYTIVYQTARVNPYLYCNQGTFTLEQ